MSKVKANLRKVAKKTVACLAETKKLSLRNMVAVAVCLVVFFTVFSGCKKDDLQPNNPPIKEVDYKLSSNVKVIGDEWDSHIIGIVTDNTIFLSSSQGLTLPKEGEILLKSKISEKFPHGFLGRVVSVNSSKIVTESVAIDEAFKELTIKYDNIDIADYIGTVTDGEGNPVLFNKQKSVPLTKSGSGDVTESSIVGTFKVNTFFVGNENSTEQVKLTGTVEVGAKLTWEQTIINNKTEYLKIAITPKLSASLSLIGEIQRNNKNDIKIGSIPFKIPVGPIPLDAELDIYAGVSVTGKISLRAELAYSHATTFGCEYNGSLQLINEDSPTNGLSYSLSKFTMDGRIGVGPSFALRCYLFKANNVSASAAIKGEALLATTAKFEWDVNKAITGDIYESFKGSKGKRSIIIGGEISVNFVFGEWFKYEPKLPVEREITLAEGLLLPDISNMQVANGTTTNQKQVSYTLKGNVLFPGKYGVRFYDKDDNVLNTNYCNEYAAYIPDLQTSTPKFPYTVTAGKTYIARPVFNLFGLEIVSSQSVKITDINIDGNGLTGSINEIVPPEIYEALIDLGVIINGGNTPPNIEGTYLATPLELVKSTASTPIAEQWDMYITFSGQNNTALTVNADYELQAEGPWWTTLTLSANGPGSFIVGQGNKFTVFVDGTREQSGYTAKTVEIFSGEMSATGIKNYQWAVVMIDNKGNPVGNWIGNGEGYLKKDSDGFSERVTKNSVSSRKAKVQNTPNKNQKPNPSKM